MSCSGRAECDRRFLRRAAAGAVGPRDLPVYKDYADNIHHSGRHLLELVNQILDVSRVEAGKIDLRMENLPLPTALTDVLQIEGAPS